MHNYALFDMLIVYYGQWSREIPIESIDSYWKD